MVTLPVSAFPPDLAPAPAFLLDAARGLARRRPSRAAERRRHVRYPVSLEVIAQHLDNERIPDGQPFRAVAAEISVRGLTILHHRVHRLGEYLVLIEEATLRAALVVRLARCEEIGSYHRYSGPFVARLDAMT